MVQLREKTCTSLEFYRTACRVRKITADRKVPLIINDRVDLALAVNADGVHIGQSDLPCRVVRKIIGPEKVVGVSAATVEEAVRAVQDGADYLGVGAMFATDTKADARPVSMDELREIRAAVRVPIVVIGGINRKTARRFRGTGIDGFAVVSAIVAQPDPAAAARELRTIFRQEVEKS